MGDSVKSGSRLEVSVSFGRFENEALSWEKWSSFSPNKYLEEVGSLSTPGSVAQKKAYFEAHYKKIAAKKAEELEQEKSSGPFVPGPNKSSNGNCSANPSESHNKFDLNNGEKLVEEIVTVNKNIAVCSEAKDDNSDRANGFVDVINLDEENEEVSGVVKCECSKIEEIKDDTNANIDEPEDEENEEVSGVVKCESSKFEEIKDDTNANIDEPELNVGKDYVPVRLKTPRMDSRDTVEKRQERKNVREPKTSVLKKENSKSIARNITHKVTPVKKEINSVRTKKKIVSTAAKPEAATTQQSKPTLISTSISVSRDLKKKANGPQPPKRNDFSARESKKDAPTSLHMSLSLGPTNSYGGLSMTRKSLIMESMGDKDIVKRAFKTFQNRTNGPMADEKPSTESHVSSTALEPNVSSFQTRTKGNIGLRKVTDKTATPRSHSGIKSTPLPSGSHRTSAMSKKKTAAVSPSTGSKSDEKSEKRKEFLKKLEAKSIARGAANAQLNAKSKTGVANEIHQRPTSSR